MGQKEITGKEELFAILDLLDDMHIKYWVDGGWGVDILLGRQTREHRDVDIDFDGQFKDALLDRLKEMGYTVQTDWGQCRIELYHPEMGYIDIHPLVIGDDGSAKQAAPDGGWYQFEAAWFSGAVFDGREIPCISAEAQKLFHSGYEPREKDLLDLQVLESLINV